MLREYANDHHISYEVAYKNKKYQLKCQENNCNCDTVFYCILCSDEKNNSLRACCENCHADHFTREHINVKK